jgi:hypothetical protein
MDGGFSFRFNSFRFLTNKTEAHYYVYSLRPLHISYISLAYLRNLMTQEKLTELRSRLAGIRRFL